MRIYIFEEDPTLLNLLMIYLKNKGHQVQGFLEEYKCPLYLLEECVCPASTPCAEAVVINTRVPNEGSIQILIDQERKGCKLPKSNKAVMSASFTDELKELVESHGFSVIKKPFRLAALTEWLEYCKTRLQITKDRIA